MEEKNKRMTLWEILKEKMSGEKEEPQELKVFNPLKAKIGDFVSIDFADLGGKNFTVVEIDVYKREIGGEIFEFADYILREGDIWVHLRVYPISNADPYSHKHCDSLILFPDFEMAYDKNFHEVILPSGILEVKNENNNILATYNRRDNLKEPFEAEVKVIEDSAKPPKIENWHFWDFERQTEDKKIEYYFVEMNTENGWFQMYRGFEVSEKDILVMPCQKS